MPLITIIVPVYNTEKYLKRCLDSILTQSFGDFELVIVNDGSEDNSPSICSQYAKVDSRIVLINQKNQGLSAARNTGIVWAMEHSDSLYLSFVDSDDWVHPRYLEWLYGTIRDKKAAVAVGKYTKVTKDYVFDDSSSFSVIPPTWLYTHNDGNFIVAWGKLFAKNDFREIRFPLGKLHEDEFTVWKIMFKYDEIAFIDTPIYAYYQRADSIMGTWHPDRLVRIDAMKEQYDWIVKNGNAELLKKVKRRIVIAYADTIMGMTEYGMPEQTVCEYREVLRGYIRSFRK